MTNNARYSQQFRGGASGSKKTQKQDDSDSLMRLGDDEIAGCISDIGVPFTSHDLRQAQTQQIQRVLEWFAELLMNTTRETVEPAMEAAAHDVCQEYADIIPYETRNLMGFYASLRKLLIECGINDFSFHDLTKPTYPRMVKIFSYIINFVRFRECQTATIDEHFNKVEASKARIDTLHTANQDLTARLSALRTSQRATEQHAARKVKRVQELKGRLKELATAQEPLVAHNAQLKHDTIRLKDALADRTERTLHLRGEGARLRPYTLQSPAALHAALATIADTLAREKGALDAAERRTRALHASSDTFALVAQDITACVRALDDVAAERAREEVEARDARRRADVLAERSFGVCEVKRVEEQLHRQLGSWEERTEQLRRGAEERAATARRRMDELASVHRALTDERAERGREVERRRVKIEQTEKKMADLKENIEREIHAAHDEFMKMDAHIKLYITEMEQAI